jgi:hypothetical protein
MTSLNCSEVENPKQKPVLVAGVRNLIKFISYLKQTLDNLK